MSLGLVGRKVGMTRVFSDDGASVPVTVIEVEPNRVTQIKTVETDGYVAVQIVTGTRRASRVTKPMAGHYKSAGVEAGRGAWEFRVDSVEEFELGSEIKVDLFEQGQIVDVSGVSKGKGFQGGVKRHNFTMQDATHGNSISHRSNGSIGQNQTPGRVFKGKKMAGHMGDRRVTTQNLMIVSTDEARGLIMVKGAVPGSADGWVMVSDAIKRKLPDDVPFPAGLRSDGAAETAESDTDSAADAALEAPAEEAALEEAATKQAAADDAPVAEDDAAQKKDD
jgi:large subunit ribosomal protein L3